MHTGRRRTVLAVGEMGLTWRFGVEVGWPRCAGVRGAGVLTLVASGRTNLCACLDK